VPEGAGRFQSEAISRLDAPEDSGKDRFGASTIRGTRAPASSSSAHTRTWTRWSLCAGMGPARKLAVTHSDTSTTRTTS